MNDDASDPSTDAEGIKPARPVILQVLPSLVTGGVERGTVDMAAAIAECGGVALVASEGGAMVREIERCGGEHIALPLASKNPLSIRANIERLAALITERGVDIVHARSRAPAWSAYYAAQQTGRPLVTTVHAPYNGRSWLKRRYNSVMARGDRVIAISHYVADYVRKNFGTPEDRLRVIYRGIDLDIFDPARVSQERVIQLARQWRLPDDAPVIMLPGRLTRWKGQTVLLEALARLGRQDVRCLLVGSDQGRNAYRRELEQQIATLGLQPVVHLVGECRDMPAAYMLADVVVHASTDPEGFGRIIAEAQSMGRPVIATAIGAPAETIRDGLTGWLVPPGDAGALAAVLGRVLALGGEAREAFAATAMAHSRILFDKADMTDRTLGVYNELLAGRGRAQG